MSYKVSYSHLNVTYSKYFATLGEALKYSVYEIPFNSLNGIDKV